MGDSFGVERVFGAGVLLFAIGGISVAIAPNDLVLLTGRAVQGAGGGLFSPLVPVLLTRAQPNAPGKILMLWGSAVGFVASGAPAMAGLLIADIGWRPVALLIALGAVPGVLLIASNSNCRAHKNPTLANRKATFLNRNAVAMFLYIFATYGVVSLFIFAIPVRVSDLRLPVDTTGLVLATFWFCFASSGLVLQKYTDKGFLRVMLIFAAVFLGAGFGIAFQFDGMSPLFFGACFGGIGFALCNAPSTQAVLKVFPQDKSAKAASLDIVFARCGSVAVVWSLASLTVSLDLSGIWFLVGFSVLLAFFYNEPSTV